MLACISSKSSCLVGILFMTAARRMMARASFVRPLEHSHRTDSGSSLQQMPRDVRAECTPRTARFNIERQKTVSENGKHDECANAGGRLDCRASDKRPTRPDPAGTATRRSSLPLLFLQSSVGKRRRTRTPSVDGTNKACTNSLAAIGEQQGGRDELVAALRD